MLGPNGLKKRFSVLGHSLKMRFLVLYPNGLKMRFLVLGHSLRMRSLVLGHSLKVKSLVLNHSLKMRSLVLDHGLKMKSPVQSLRSSNVRSEYKISSAEDYTSRSKKNSTNLSVYNFSTKLTSNNFDHFLIE